MIAGAPNRLCYLPLPRVITGLTCAHRAQQRAPLFIIHSPANVSHTGEQRVILHVEKARGVVCAFHEGSEADEAIALVAERCAEGDAAKLMGLHLHPVKKLAQAATTYVLEILAPHLQPECVDVLVHLGGDGAAHAAGSTPLPTVPGGQITSIARKTPSLFGMPGGSKYHHKTFRSSQIWCSTCASELSICSRKVLPARASRCRCRFRSTYMNPAIHRSAGTVRYHVHGLGIQIPITIQTGIRTRATPTIQCRTSSLRNLRQ